MKFNKIFLAILPELVSCYKIDKMKISLLRAVIVVIGLCIAFPVSKVTAQKTFPVSAGYLEKLPKLEILRGAKSSANFYLNEITKDSLIAISKVGGEEGGLTLYTYSAWTFGKVGEIRVTKDSKKLLPRIIGGIVLGTAGALIGRELIAREKETPLNAVLVNQEDDKLFPTLIGGVLGAGLGVVIGGFASGKKFHLQKDQEREVARLKKFVGELPALRH